MTGGLAGRIKSKSTGGRQDPRPRLLSSLGLSEETAYQLLFYAPTRFKDYGPLVSRVSLLSSVPLDSPVCFSGQLVAKTYFDRDRRPTSLFDKIRKPFRADLIVEDEVGRSLPISCFGNVWQFKDVEEGDPIVLHGTITEFRGQRQLGSPMVIPVELAGQVHPVYPAIRGKVSADDVFQVIRNQLMQPGTLAKAADYLERLTELDDDAWRAMTNVSTKQLLGYLHAPKKVVQGEYCLKAAKKVMVSHIHRLGELSTARHFSRAAQIDIDKGLARKTIQDVEKQGFRLTTDQRAAIMDILNDLVSPYPMRRLLSGDVGTGKTITFLAPAMIAHRAGHQVAVLVPNEPIANQILADVRRICPDIPVQVVTGQTGKLQMGALLIGTTALISRVQKAGIDLNLLIVDEQHKFSRGQREILVGPKTNYVEATATAIPRTMALVTHAGMAVSQLRQRPFERTVTTKVLLGKQESGRELFAIAQSAMDAGQQIAIVYAAVDESDKVFDVDSAAAIWERVFPGQVASLHGKMDSQEKARVIQSFRDNEKQMLVCSTVIEVGVSLPSLQVILVINAGRHGASQLHQLRGRVARNGGTGLCVFYEETPIDSIDPDTLARLRMVAENDDGFLIASNDLAVRGFGDLAGQSDAQSGKSLGIFHNIPVFPSDLEAPHRPADNRVLSSKNDGDRVGPPPVAKPKTA